MHAISIGEILWDVSPAGEFLGGAPFNFAFHLSRLGHRVSFVSGVGRDERGRRILARVAQSGIAPGFLAEIAEYPTGWADIVFDAAGQPDFVIHHPVAYDFPQLDDASLRQLLSNGADCLSYGTLQQMSQPARALTRRLIEATPDARRFYDLNLRKNCFTPQLVRDLLSLATIVKMSEHEAETVAGLFGGKLSSLESFCRDFRDRFGWEGIAITRGERGCAALVDSEYVEAPAMEVTAVDPVGAGDAFSAAFVHGLAAGWPCRQIAAFANRVAALIVSRPGAVPEWNPQELSP